ncbi:DJ-1/PfpI family protein [Fusibacter bizertensis]|uniref:DJ-1/PfpI family protein n=1 Tax=Fusibacter bizertensis TaxID=1488331 RepID=A0ABT6N9N0_9FIRM|nr:DJ-1 family glyoxalase III [Fusibacter bizertensis]MDH8677104.1 DJ-1/PfpI family protein [Fusibacter bizertensis]
MVYVFFAEGFEEIEALTVIDVLRRADIRTHMIGLNGLSVTGAHGIEVKMDGRISEIHTLSDVSMLVLPGGMPGAMHLAESDVLRNLLLQAYDSDIHLAAICAAPTVLSKHGLLKGRNVTCYPGFETQLRDFKHVDESVVHDGELITGKGAGVAMDFALKLVEILKGHKLSEQLSQSLIHTNK